MARLKFRILLTVPLIVFLGLFFAFAVRGRQGEWNERCRSLWRQQNWWGLRAIAINLQRLEKPDAEAEYFAALAAHELKDDHAAAEFSLQWLHRKALNWRWESDLSNLTPTKSLLETVRFLRTRIASLVLIGLIVLNLLAFKQPGWMLGSMLISFAGIAVLLL